MEADFSARSFQFTRETMASHNWLPVRRFQALAESAAGKSVDIPAVLGDQARQTLHSSIVYWLTTRATQPFFVGIQGGAARLRGLSFDEIDQQSWQIGLTPDSAQWVPAATFRAIHEEKWPQTTTG
jgi:hypothetical protein